MIQKVGKSQFWLGAFAAMASQAVAATGTTAAPTAPAAYADIAPDSELLPLLDDVLDDTGLVGIGIAVVRGGKIVGTATAGERIQGSGEPISSGAHWHIGSITKSITATLAARLAERGSLSFDTTVGEVFPNANDSWKDATLSDLLTHRSGAPANFGIAAMFKPDPQPESPESIRDRRHEEVMTVITTMTTNERGAFLYSNLGYTIAGAMMETVVGKPWQELIAAEVLGPLGIPVTVGAPDGENAPWGHRKTVVGKVPLDPAGAADNPRFLGPAGTLSMPLEDLALYGYAHLSRDQRLLRTKSYERLHTPPVASGAGRQYAYGWVNDDEDLTGFDTPVIWHNGSNNSWYALLVLLPEEDLVIAIGTNDGDLEAAGQRFFRLARDVAAMFDTAGRKKSR